MPTIQPHHVYKVYEGADFVGTIPKVLSPFGYEQQINTAGPQIEIKIGVGLKDVGAEEVVDNLVTEGGDFIITEGGDQIVTDLDYDFENAPINLGNRVKIYEYSDYHPSGIIVFDGFISMWRGDYNEDTMTLVVLAHGVEMNNYIIDTALDLSVQQDEYDSQVELAPAASFSGVSVVGIARAETFQVLSDTEVSSISQMAKIESSGGIGIARLTLVEGTPSAPGSVLGQVDVIVSNTSEQFIDFQFGVPVPLIANTTYHYTIQDVGSYTSSYRRVIVFYKNSDVYANGQAFTGIVSGSGITWTPVSVDMTFRVNTNSGSIGGVFTGQDPSDMVRSALDVFNAQGGVVTYDSGSIDDTGLSLTYTFRLGTIFEAVEKAREMSSGDWYWYVDPATNVLYFKPTSQAVDHLLVLRKHISTFSIERRLDDLVNAVYFSGGDVGAGENLFVLVKNQGSINRYRQWLARVSDNRVIEQATAEALASGAIGRNASPAFTVFVSVPLTEYDTTTLLIGQTIGLAGFGNLIDTLELQVVGKRTGTDVVTLELGTLRPRLHNQVEQHERRLIALETVDNPDSPS